MNISEHNEKVLDKFATMIITRMEEMKSGKWSKGWIGKTLGGNPVNVEGRSYTGSNVFLLMLYCSMQDFEYPVYCTLKQANRMGAHVLKGSESMPVIFWDYSITDARGRKIKYEDYKVLSKADRQSCRVIPFLKSYNVFNLDQTNLKEKVPAKIADLTKNFVPHKKRDTKGMYANKQIDDMLKNQSWICPIDADKTSKIAAYYPSLDRIVVPTKLQFNVSNIAEEIYKDGQEYYATLLHEMIHSTGTESRLNRTTGKRFGDKLYAKEELVAELGAARCGQVLGFDKRILDNNAVYLDSWIKALKEEPKYILQLIGDVDKASRMILEKISD